MDSFKQNNILNYLWSGLIQQDALLQSYRVFHLTYQSIFLAIGAVVSSSLIITEKTSVAVFLYIILFVITIISIYNLIVIRKIIISRGNDVSHFQKRIIKIENFNQKSNELSNGLSEKVLTSFKLYQKINREMKDFDEFISEVKVNQTVLDSLVDRGLGHTRRVLDNHLFFGFITVWITLQILSILDLILKFCSIL